MRNFRTSVAFLLLTVAFSGALPAANLSDDFTSGIDPAVWTVISNTTVYTIDSSQGDIRISKPVGGDYTLQTAGLKLRAILRGDFDVQVDFRNASIDRFDGSPGNQVQMNLQVGPQFFALVRSDEAAAGHNIHVWRDPPAAWTGAQTTTVTNGRFRFTRTGIHVTAFLDSNVIDQGDYNSGDATVEFVLQNNQTRDATSVTFDNFAVSVDEIISTSESPTLKIVPAGTGMAQISWTPDTGTDWVLQETPSLSPTNWVNSASGTNNPVTVSALGNTKFYRLFKP